MLFYVLDLENILHHSNHIKRFQFNTIQWKYTKTVPQRIKVYMIYTYLKIGVCFSFSTFKNISFKFHSDQKHITIIQFFHRF